MTTEDATWDAPVDTGAWIAPVDSTEWPAPADGSEWSPSEASGWVGGGDEVNWEQPASGPVFAADVPVYMQAYSLSCEYAAAFIATSAFGNGVPESAFMEQVPQSENPTGATGATSPALGRHRRLWRLRGGAGPNAPGMGLHHRRLLRHGCG